MFDVGQCDTCRFFSSHFKECRKNPPIVTIKDEIECVGFPAVTSDDWCGEYQNENRTT